MTAWIGHPQSPLMQDTGTNVTMLGTATSAPADAGLNLDSKV